MPLMCRSTGREPIAQPPGSDTSAAPYFASNGPSTSTDARIVLTNSYGATWLFTLRGSTHDPALAALADRALVDGDLRTQAGEQLRGRHHIVQMRNVADLDGLVGKQGRAEDRQHRVLRAGNLHVAIERRAALDLDLLHVRRLGLVGRERLRASAWISPPMRSPSVAYTMRWRASGNLPRNCLGHDGGFEMHAILALHLRTRAGQALFDQVADGVGIHCGAVL